VTQTIAVDTSRPANAGAAPVGFDALAPDGGIPYAYDPRTGIGRVLSRVKIALMEALDRELVPLDITGAQYVILVNLASGQADSTTTLCKGVSYDPGAMTRMLDRLEKKGLVQRSRCPNDRRKVKLELTAEGNAIYPQVVAIAGGVMQRFLAGFAPNEIATLEALLARMLANA
jgi:DNA-binding MarR family transcriptional regulator